MIFSIIVLLFVQWDSLFTDWSRLSLKNQVSAILFLIWFAFVIANSSLNLHFINSYYPNQLPEKWMRHLSIILFIPTLAIVAIFIIKVIAAFLDKERSIWTSERPMKQWIAIFSVLILICSGTYILWNQWVLRKTLKRNYKANLENFLEEEENPNTHATT